MAFLGIIFMFGVVSSQSQTAQASLYRDQQTSYGNFKVTHYQHLSATVITSFLTEDDLKCPFKCAVERTCFSYNLAAHPDSNGRHLCEMLATDKYRARHKLQPNASFHHFSPVVSYCVLLSLLLPNILWFCISFRFLCSLFCVIIGYSCGFCYGYSCPRMIYETEKSIILCIS